MKGYRHSQIGKEDNTTCKPQNENIYFDITRKNRMYVNVYRT